MADLGPAGAGQVALLATMSEAEMNRAGDLIVVAAHDGVQRTGKEFETAMAVVAAIAGAGAGTTADQIALKFGLRVADVERISAHYNTAMQSGLRGVLGAVGLSLNDPNVRAAIPDFSRFAEGGVEDHRAEIAPAGAWRLWAEPETGGEAYIPLAPAKRERSLRIWEETGRRLGALESFAAGGFTSAASVPRPPSVAGYGAYGVSAEKVMGSAYELAKWAMGKAVPAVSAGSATGLDPGFLQRFRMYEQALGMTLQITSGFRSYAQQAALYDRWVRRVPGQAQAAPPGRSNHEKGLAIDHAPHSSASMRAVAGRFRLRYPMSFEPWHVEPFARGEILASSRAAVRQQSGLLDAGGPLRSGTTYTPPTEDTP